MSITIMVLRWHDTVTTESAENGDYESCGNDERSIRFDSLTEAADQFVAWYQGQRWETSDDYVNNVHYAADPDRDYHTGEEHYDRLILHVDGTEAIKTDRQKRIERALNYLISKKLS